MTHIHFPQCDWCKNFHSHTESSRIKTCEAFPGGIPEDIYENYFDHRVPYQYGNDHGIQFEEQTNPEAFPKFFRRAVNGAGVDPEKLRQAVFSDMEQKVKSLKGKKYRPDPNKY